MTSSKLQLWQRFVDQYVDFPDIGLSLDVSRIDFPADFFARMQGPIETAFKEMAELEKGAIANKDENRMVGHYWLRNPTLAPSPEIRKEIEDTIAHIKSFASQIHSGQIKGRSGPFRNLLLIGIGGSALGPQFVAKALGTKSDRLTPYFFDNTDPDGMDKALSQIDDSLPRTLCIVVSKSGGTKETRNGMLEAKAAYEKAGLNFGTHTVAITSTASELDKYANANGFLDRFPMWDWVGGRTSELSAVGLLPAALQGFDIDAILLGARQCDEITRFPSIGRFLVAGSSSPSPPLEERAGERRSFTNPAALLALAWYATGNGKGAKIMVVLPYKDRLELFSRYLQQLVMESLGKEKDRSGKIVNQGLTVFGNKGSTDQHAYVQQLRDGLNNFFVTFIEVLRDRTGDSMRVEPDVTSGDFLSGFYQGTREALYEKGRQSLTITLKQVSPFHVGVLVALFERAVGFYASLININAYHQPGVEAGKKAAGSVIEIQRAILKELGTESQTTAEIAQIIGRPDDVETVFKICDHLSANPDRGIARSPGRSPAETTYAKT
jgi:glucose-6-phosphate isomerase